MRTWIGAYKQSKYLAEGVVWDMIRDADLPAVIVNPSTPVGPRDIKPTPTGRLIVESAKGKMPAFVETGLNLVHVDDVADGHWRAFKKGRLGQRYILGGEDWTLRDILEEIAALTDGKPPKIALPHGLVMPIAWMAETWAKAIRTDKEPFATVDGVRMARKKMFFSSFKAKKELDLRAAPGAGGTARRRRLVPRQRVSGLSRCVA